MCTWDHGCDRTKNNLSEAIRVKGTLGIVFHGEREETRTWGKRLPGAVDWCGRHRGNRFDGVDTLARLRKE